MEFQYFLLLQVLRKEHKNFHEKTNRKRRRKKLLPVTRHWPLIFLARKERIHTLLGTLSWGEWSLVRNHSSVFFASHKNGLKPDNNPLNSFMRVSVCVGVEKSGREGIEFERGREDCCLILIWPCIAFHGPLYTWRWGMCVGKHGVPLAMAYGSPILSTFPNKFFRFNCNNHGPGVLIAPIGFIRYSNYYMSLYYNVIYFLTIKVYMTYVRRILHWINYQDGLIQCQISFTCATYWTT